MGFRIVFLWLFHKDTIVKSKEELELVVEDVAVTISANMILAGEFFRAVQDKIPDRFAELAFLTGIHVWEAERLAALDRHFKELKVDRERMYRIGLAKLQVIAVAFRPRTASLCYDWRRRALFPN